jgi:hypothetical protein
VNPFCDLKESVGSQSSHSSIMSDSDVSVYEPTSDDESFELFQGSVDQSNSDSQELIMNQQRSQSSDSSYLITEIKQKKSFVHCNNVVSKIMPAYDVDPCMFIVFEMSDPTKNSKNGDCSVRLSPDRIKRGVIKYILAVPIYPRTIYLTKNAHSHCHYGVWFKGMSSFIMEASSSGVEVQVLGKECREHKDITVLHDHDCDTMPSFNILVKRCRNKSVTSEQLTIDVNRSTKSDNYGFSTGNYELEEESQLNLPAVKKNYNLLAGQTMLIIGKLLNEVDPSGKYHKIDRRRQRNYASRIALKCGLSTTDSREFYLEGMTYNQTTIVHNTNMDTEASPSPHCDVNNGYEVGNNFLICFSWMESKNTLETIRHVILGYMRRGVSQAIKRGILADSIETVVNQYLASLPRYQRMIDVHYLSKQMRLRRGTDSLFLLPSNMEKETYYSLIVTDMLAFANSFRLGYFKRVELLCILFLANGPDRIHTVLRHWMKKKFCPKGLLPCAFMSSSCDMFGSTASVGGYMRYQFSTTFGTTIDDWIRSLVTIGRVCLLANDGDITYVLDICI